ncbi:MAG: DUF4114 domain-containing protein [Acidobacteriota bacterium]
MHMITSNSTSYIRQFLVLGMVLSLLGLMISAPQPARAFGALPQAAECQSGVGGRLFSNGGDAEVEILPQDAGFTLELSLISPGPSRFIGTNRDSGLIVKLGSFPAGAELVFSVFVRETQRTFVMGSGSGNADGIAHAEVTCFSVKRANIGFEDQLGGGDRDYNDLLCTVRQTQSCNYSLSPASQSFGSGGGSGSVNVGAASSCSWSAASNVGWVTITSGGSGSESGRTNYSVAMNQNTDSRTGTISVQGQTFTVFQDGAGSQPQITGTFRKSDKKMFVYGINFDGGSVILLNGEEQKTLYDVETPTTKLIGKKLSRWVQPGDTLQVRNSSGAVSPGHTYTP